MNWVIIANATECVIYKRFEKDHTLQEITRISHPEGRMIEQKLKEGKPGRVYESGPKSFQRHTKDTEVNPHTQELVAFARQINTLIEHNRNTKAFDRLIVIAEPHFLGILNSIFNQKIQKLIALTINKDLIKTSLDKVIEIINKQEKIAS